MFKTANYANWLQWLLLVAAVVGWRSTRSAAAKVEVLLASFLSTGGFTSSHFQCQYQCLYRLWQLRLLRQCYGTGFFCDCWPVFNCPLGEGRKCGVQVRKPSYKRNPLRRGVDVVFLESCRSRAIQRIRRRRHGRLPANTVIVGKAMRFSVGSHGNATLFVTLVTMAPAIQLAS